MNIYIIKEGSQYEPEEVWPKAYRSRAAAAESIEQYVQANKNVEKFHWHGEYWKSEFDNFIRIQQLEVE